MSKQERLIKKVSLDILGQDNVQTFIEKGFLSEEFAKVIMKTASAEVKLSNAHLSLTANCDDFQALVDQGVFSSSIVDAFKAADEKVTTYYQERGFMKKLNDVINYQPGRANMYSSVKVAEVKGAKVTVKSYNI